MACEFPALHQFVRRDNDRHKSDAGGNKHSLRDLALDTQFPSGIDRVGNYPGYDEPDNPDRLALFDDNDQHHGLRRGERNLFGWDSIRLWLPSSNSTAMSENPRDELLSKSRAIGIPRAVAQDANSMEAKILLALHEQNLKTDRTNDVIFAKLDAATVAAADAKAAAGEAHVEAIYVRKQFEELNGRTSKTIERVASLEYRNEQSDKLVADQKLIEQGRREGFFVVPKFAAWAIGGIVTFLGSLVIAWPAITSIWHYFVR
jgi:hypothetical protein